MGLIQKLKSALGLDGAQSPEPGTAPPRDVDVTVEREPSSESEDAVKGTETAASETVTTDEPDSEEATTDESTPEESPIDEAEPTDEGDSGAESETADETESPETGEPVDESDEDSVIEPSDEPSDPVTEITGIGNAYGERLENAGVENVADLAAADAQDLADATDIAPGRVEGWIDAAQEY